MYYNTRMIQILQEAARKAGTILLSYYRKNPTLSYKSLSHHNIVTEADIKSQKFIQEYLIKEFQAKYSISANDIGFIGEEGLYKPRGKYVFAIDPLDGTSTFASGLEFFAVSIGLFVSGDLQCGVIYQPVQDKLYYAEKNKGSFIKDGNTTKQLHINQHNLKHMHFAGGLSVYDDLRKKQLAMYDRLFPHFRGFLSINSGCYSMCMFAEDTLGLYFMGGPWIWDLAGGHLIIEEAGGLMVDWQGEKFSYSLKEPDKRYPFMACHPDNLQKILGFMK